MLLVMKTKSNIMMINELTTQPPARLALDELTVLSTSCSYDYDKVEGKPILEGENGICWGGRGKRGVGGEGGGDDYRDRSTSSTL